MNISIEVESGSMNLFESFIYSLTGEMTTPVPWGWFHIMWIFLTLGALLFLFLFRKKYNEKQLKIVLGTYGIVALILELLKQIMWSMNFDPQTNVVTWSYQWYAAPFQLCTTPIYVSLICLFLKKGKVRDSLLSYMAFATILGSVMTILLPDSCFVSDILVNIHTMFLHCGSLVVSVYILMNKEIDIKFKNLLSAFWVFLCFVCIAEFMNIAIYNSGILDDQTFNMFYISPYFVTHLPVYNFIQENTPFIVYLLFYIASIFIGALVIYGIASILKFINQKIKS